MKSAAIWIDRAMLTCPYYIGLVTSEAEFVRELDRLKVKPENRPSHWIPEGKDATVQHFADGTGKYIALVCIHCPTLKPQSASEICGLLIHESVHIWQLSKRQLGEDEPGDETEAYAIQWIAQQLIHEYSKRARKPKGKR